MNSGGLLTYHIGILPLLSFSLPKPSQPVGVESHFRVGGRMFEWKELHDPHKQLEGPGRDGQKTEKAEMPRNKGNVGGRADSCLMLVKTFLRHRLNPARTNVREVI